LEKIHLIRSERRNDEAFFNRIRKKEYARLDKLNHVYLDYTGGNLYPESLVKMHADFLQKAVYGNPHSDNPASHLSEKYITEARTTVSDFFNARNYYCIFTANASAALKIVGECYPFSSDGHFLLTADNHNSVNGIRDYCSRKNCCYTYVAMNNEDLSINEGELNKQLHAYADKKNKLFAYPAQSNASGTKHSLEWIKTAQRLGWDVLLDAATFVPTSILDLSVIEPDFVPVSFYKIFGYPTGAGCLLVKKLKFNKLKKPWYAGGTITVSSVRYNDYFLKTDHEKFEDGTVNYLNIPAVTNGLNFISAIGMQNISAHVQQLCKLFLQQLQTLKHYNGKPLIKLYGSKNTENRGATFLINFFDIKGQLYPFHFIEEKANANMISLRTGCFCNPGIDETNHCINRDQLKDYFTGRQHGDYFDMIQYLRKLRGAVRVSFGFPTSSEDILKFIHFAKTFLNKKVPERFVLNQEQNFIEQQFHLS
jgi:selenocysteine lyase/cysteine desulfurase